MWSLDPPLRRGRAGERSAPASSSSCWRCFPDGPAIWAGCLRRLGAWRVPPHWSARDWIEEMQAQGAAAACQAARDYDPGRGVPWGAFVRQRVLASLLTRHRQEWSYARHCPPAAPAGDGADRGGAAPPSPRVDEALRASLARLAEPDRRLIEHLFWHGCTETDVASELGVAQSTVNKHKRAILLHLRRAIGSPGGARA